MADYLNKSDGYKRKHFRLPCLFMVTLAIMSLLVLKMVLTRLFVGSETNHDCLQVTTYPTQRQIIDIRTGARLSSPIDRTTFGWDAAPDNRYTAGFLDTPDGSNSRDITPAIVRVGIVYSGRYAIPAKDTHWSGKSIYLTSWSSDSRYVLFMQGYFEGIEESAIAITIDQRDVALFDVVDQRWQPISQISDPLSTDVGMF